MCTAEACTGVHRCACALQAPFSHDAAEETMDNDEMYLDHAEVITLTLILTPTATLAPINTPTLTPTPHPNPNPNLNLHPKPGWTVTCNARYNALCIAL